MTNRLTTRFAELEAYGRPGFVAYMMAGGDKDVPRVADMLGVEL